MLSLLKRWGVLIVVALGILTACDDSFDLTLDIRQTELINTLYTDTLTLRTNVQYLDSIQTNNFILVGSAADAEVGTLRAESFFKVLLPRDTLRFTVAGNNTVIFDSLVLILDYNYQYGDTTVAQTIVVNRLTASPDTARNYYSFERMPFGEELGRFTYRLPRNRASMRIRMSDAFARDLISKEGRPELLNQTNFEQYFKGLRIAAEGPDNAAIFGFDLIQSRMSLFYRNDAADTVSKSHSFYFYNPARDALNQIILRDGSAFARLNADFSKGRLFANLPARRSIPTQQVGNFGYVHSGMGIATRIEIPHLQALQKPNKRILINRALLSFNPSARNFEAAGKVNAPPPATVLLGISDRNGRIVRNASGLPIFVPDERNPNVRMERNYVEAGRTYPDLDITTYVQRLLDGKTPNNGMLLMSLLNTAPGNLLIVGDQNAVVPAERMQLKLFYTELSQ
ncbi:DUF4270 family protein [Rhodoflexus caldus]|uniref:DUF4270 family protein n=1 Tax=Rhodoflexus caldus TaxID=2891236 RepID=UPI00202A24CC|nr:DUF4270 family protein [Rhodoflexus caldus]